MAISADTAAEAETMMKEKHFRLPIASDPDARVIDRYGLREKDSGISVPAVFVIQTDGRIAWFHVGTSARDRPSLDEIYAALDSL